MKLAIPKPGHLCPKCEQIWASRVCFREPAYCDHSDRTCPACLQNLEFEEWVALLRHVDEGLLWWRYEQA